MKATNHAKNDGKKTTHTHTQQTYKNNLIIKEVTRKTTKGRENLNQIQTFQTPYNTQFLYIN